MELGFELESVYQFFTDFLSFLFNFIDCKCNSYYRQTTTFYDEGTWNEMDTESIRILRKRYFFILDYNSLFMKT